MTQKSIYNQLSLDRQAYSNKVLKKLNIEVELYGEIPKQNKVLYAINHRSLLDIIIMENVLSKHNKCGAWIAKEELFNAFYGDFFKYSGCISVDIENKKGLLKFFKQIKNVLNDVDNLNIYIFPEGQRNKEKEVKSFQSGASKIAIANKLDVVPVFINDTLETVLKHAPYKKKKVVQVHVGELIGAKTLEDDYINFMKNIKDKTDE